MIVRLAVSQIDTTCQQLKVENHSTLVCSTLAWRLYLQMDSVFLKQEIAKR